VKISKLIKLFNAITGKSVPEVNFMQEAYKYIGKKLGREKGGASKPEAQPAQNNQ